MTFDKTYLLIETDRETGDTAVLDTFNFYPEAIKTKRFIERTKKLLLRSFSYEIVEDKPLITIAHSQQQHDTEQNKHPVLR